MEKNLPTKKADLRIRLTKETADFLTKGGEIKVIPTGMKSK